jgi:hypothetical protein
MMPTTTTMTPQSVTSIPRKLSVTLSGVLNDANLILSIPNRSNHKISIYYSLFSISICRNPLPLSPILPQYPIRRHVVKTASSVGGAPTENQQETKTESATMGCRGDYLSMGVFSWP